MVVSEGVGGTAMPVLLDREVQSGDTKGVSAFRGFEEEYRRDQNG